MRLPDVVASLPLARAMLNLFASVWERRYEHVYSRGEALFNLARQGDVLHTEVSGVLTTLVTHFIGKRNFENLLALIYDVISRVFPPTDHCVVVESVYSYSPGARPGIPWSASRRTPIYHVGKRLAFRPRHPYYDASACRAEDQLVSSPIHLYDV